MLAVRLLGQFDVRRDGTPLTIPARAAQSLLAYLLLSAGTTHRREQLAGLLWPETTDDKARSNLRHELWRLRQALETKTPRKGVIPYLVVDEISIGFNAASAYWLDVAEVHKALPKPGSADQLIETLSLYRGELLPGWYDEWVVLERERVQAVFEQKMARLLELLVQDQRWTEVLDWSERWIAMGQTPEPAYRALMVAHHALGNMSQVAAIYERCVRALREDLGVEPSGETRSLFERLSTGEKIPPRETRAEPPAVPAPAVRARPRPLPVPLTSFIGREREIGQVKELLSTTRLLTLFGAGGVGKTRLAIQLAGELSGQYKDSAWWVDLVALADPALVPQAVAKALGVLQVPNVPLVETLTDALCSMQALLVLDNCEHLIAACAELVNALLGACASLKILTTSRESLGISGETIWHVPSLSLPEPGSLPGTKDLDRYESIRLFVERARAARSDFTVDDRNAGLIVQISQKLDGIPLAIELAAARVKTLSVQQIAARLDDRFSLLTKGSRTALPRQQTLRATIDWSHDLISEPERMLFRRLSVFAGGWTLEAAEAVCAGDGLEQGQVLELLSRLVDKSLVIVGERDGAARYRMLETIREYAREKLREAGEEDRLRNQHLAFFVNLVEEAEPRLEGAEQRIWLDRVETEFDNIRSSIDWAQSSHQIVSAQRILAGLRRFWLDRNHDREGIERLESLLHRPDAAEPTLVRLRALNTFFHVLWPAGQLAKAQPLIEQALALGANLADRWNTAFALLWAGVSATEQGDYPRARSYLEQARVTWQELGDTTYMGWSFVFLGEVAMFQNDHVHAKACFEQARPQLKQARDYVILALVIRRLGQLAMYEGELVKATSLIKESLLLNWSIHDYRGTGACVAGLAALSMARGQNQEAVKLLAIVDALIEFTQIAILPYDQQHYEQNVLALRKQLDEATFAAAWAEGRALTLEQAVAFAQMFNH